MIAPLIIIFCNFKAVRNIGLIKNKEDFNHFIFPLKNRLKLPLPGKQAQMKMASKVRLDDLKSDYDLSNAIPSGILILLYPADDQIRTVLILRQTYDGVHSGQVSFPGGRQEKTDNSILETALRESFEEVNIDPLNVTVIGTLSEMYIPPSNFQVLPVVGYSEIRPDFKPDKSEVEKIIETNLDFLFDKNLRKETLLNIRGYRINAPYFDVQGHIVWGATAMILNELKEVIESVG